MSNQIALITQKLTKQAKVFYDEYAYRNFIPVQDIRKFITKTLKNAQKRSYSSEGGASVGDIVALKKAGRKFY